MYHLPAAHQDRLAMCALIEEELPRRAREQGWPIRLAEEFAHLIFDPCFGGPFRDYVPEPFYHNLSEMKLQAGLGIARNLMKLDAGGMGDLIKRRAP